MFDEMPDIIHTDIVSAAYDVFWNDLPNWIESLPKRKVMIITRPFEKGSPEAIQLSKIIAACKLEEDAYNCIHLPENVFLAWPKLRDILGINTILLFGIQPAELGVTVQLMPHQISRFNQANWIVTAGLTELMSEKLIKNHLWNYGLKPVFIDKAYG